MASLGLNQRASRGAWPFAALLLVPLFVVLMATATRALPYHIDAATNVFAGWTIGTTGSPILHDYAVLVDPSERGIYGWVVESKRGPVAQYPPGAALLVAPLYATMWRDAPITDLVATNDNEDRRLPLPMPDLLPAAIVAAGTTAGALVLIALTIRHITGSSRLGMGASIIGAFGSSAWTVAADQLWQHGPNMFWLSLGVYLAVKERWLLAGLAFGALCLTRPPVVLIGIAIGAMLLGERRWSDAGRLLAGAVPGVAALLAYNWYLFGRLTVSGGYGDSVALRATDPDLASYASNIAAALFDPSIGLFIYSPFLVLLLFGLRRARANAPGVVVASALGGVAYLLLQLKLNRASGGTGFNHYRYPLETLAASGPLMTLAWFKLWATSVIARAGLVLTTLLGFGLHAIVAF